MPPLWWCRRSCGAVRDEVGQRTRAIGIAVFRLIVDVGHVCADAGRAAMSHADSTATAKVIAVIRAEFRPYPNIRMVCAALRAASVVTAEYILSSTIHKPPTARALEVRGLAFADYWEDRGSHFARRCFGARSLQGLY